METTMEGVRQARVARVCTPRDRRAHATAHPLVAAPRRLLATHSSAPCITLVPRRPWTVTYVCALAVTPALCLFSLLSPSLVFLFRDWNCVVTGRLTRRALLCFLCVDGSSLLVPAPHVGLLPSHAGASL